MTIVTSRHDDDEAEAVVPLGSADVPESRSFRTIGGIASRPFSRLGAVKSVEITGVHTPHPMAFRQ